VAPVRAARDLEDAIIAEVADVRGIALELVGIELRCHIAAATPVLVTNAEVFDFPRRLVAIFLAPICHWADPGKGDVFDPLLHLLNRAAANIAANVGLTPDLLTKIHELVCPEMIILDHAPPMSVDHGRSLLCRPNALSPMVFVGETSAGPAQDRH